MEPTMKNKVLIHQIFYNSEVRKTLDEGFIPLDNMKNDRPDWREYWPIRNYLLNEPLDENNYYGFFSPKFREKTTLSSQNCYSFISDHQGHEDVFLFSPLFDLSAFFLNSFLQASKWHQGSIDTFKRCLFMLEPSVNIETLVMNSMNNVFCNFFVAKPGFWNAWLDRCELIFDLAEKKGASAVEDPVVQSLNSVGVLHDSPAQLKTFVIERVASLLLATQEKKWKVRAYNSMELPFSSAPISIERGGLLVLDALKIAYTCQGHPQYLQEYYSLRDLIGKKVEQMLLRFSATTGHPSRHGR
jgi:hypothetical protein